MIHRPLALFILPLICVLGCYGTKTVKIKVELESQVDLGKYKTIAVLDFIDNSGKTAGEQGSILARMIRKQLKKSKQFKIMSEKDMRLTLDMEVDKDDIEDPAVLASICDQLGVDALIVGSFDFYQVNRPVPYIAERYRF